MEDLPDDILSEILSNMSFKQLRNINLIPCFNKLINITIINKIKYRGFPRTKAIIYNPSRRLIANDTTEEQANQIIIKIADELELIRGDIVIGSCCNTHQYYITQLIYDGIRFHKYHDELPNEFTLLDDNLPIDYYNNKERQLSFRLNIKPIRGELLKNLLEAKFDYFYDDCNFLCIPFSGVNLLLVGKGDREYLIDEFDKKIKNDIIKVTVARDNIYF
jgi:hypothetical protein